MEVCGNVCVAAVVKNSEYVLNKFIKLPNILISLFTYPLNLERLYLQPIKLDSEDSTKKNHMT